LNYNYSYRENKPEKPKEGCSLGRLFFVDTLQELDLGEDLNVIEDPVEEEPESAQNIQDFLVLWHSLLI